MFLLRDVQKTDLPSLKRLAEVLNTVNLNNNDETLEAQIDKSVRSFSGKIKDPAEREYLFVLEDLDAEMVVGTSMVIAQHGTFDAPHVYYDVTEREHYSATIDRHFRHKVLSIGFNYEGPTEIGGLVVDPKHRSGPMKPGKQLSYVRFLFIALHRKWFREKVLAELLPPLMADGRSLVWEACGKKFTGLSYQEADRLSRMNKEFIKELFPTSDIYASLFTERAQKIIGEVGPETRGVERMLKRIGFRYADRIDPFDGGPHYEAKLDDLTLVQKFRSARLAEEELDEPLEETHLVGFDRENGKNRFRAVRTEVKVEDGLAYLPREARATLGAHAGARLAIIPFE